MPDSSSISTDEVARFSYLDWHDLYEKEKPYRVLSSERVSGNTKEVQDNNLKFQSKYEEIIHNARGLESEFALDKNGFEFRRYETTLGNEFTPEEVEATYLPECERILKQALPDADIVFMFDWRQRKADPSVGYLSYPTMNFNDRSRWVGPTSNPHIDESPAAILSRIELSYKEKAAELLKCRIRMVNVWRPLVPKVLDWPLALSDSRTLNDADLVETDVIRKNYVGGKYYVRYREGLKWYYLKDQTRDEVALFKSFDSNDSVEAKHCVHAAFKHSSIPENYAPRESIEVRALVFTYPKD